MKTAKKVRIQTTLSQVALDRAGRLMEAFGYSDLNDLVDRLITEEFERRHGKITLEDPNAPMMLNESSRQRTVNHKKTK